ncbi:MAG: class I SAM-dependent methyltransferase [Ruegeria sp.]
MPDQKTIDAYSTRLEDYLKVPLPAEQIAARQAFVDAVGSGGYVLDLGSGPGSDSVFFLRSGLRVRALDATAEFVQKACDIGVDAHLGTFDDVTQTAEYDGIFASFSLLHAPREDFSRHLQAIHRALKPKGVLFLGMKLGTGAHRDKINRYYTYYTQPEIQSALTDAGFSISEVTTGEGEGLAGYYEGFVLVIAHA